MDTGNVCAYINRACIEEGLEDHRGALADFTAGLEAWERTGDASTKLMAAGAYWRRGATYSSLGQEELSCEDYNRAIGIGLRVCINPENGRLTTHPPEDYRR